MDIGFETQVIEGLDALSRNEPIARIVSRYPADAARLQLILEIAAALPQLRREPSEPARMRSRRAFLVQAARLCQVAGWTDRSDNEADAANVGVGVVTLTQTSDRCKAAAAVPVNASSNN
jgi:hypothetical protein